MARRTAIRASDGDRELVAERLREATGEGRLLPAELEERLTVALRAQTHGQLAMLVSDLPSSDGGERAVPIWARATLGVAGAVGVAAAAATAAMLFSLIAAVSAIWMLLGRMLGGARERRARHHGARSEEHPLALHGPPARHRLPRGGRASL